MTFEPSTVGVWVLSWFCGRNVVPKSSEFRLIDVYWFHACCPTYETSNDVFQGSVICAPEFHWSEDGRPPAYSNTDRAGAEITAALPAPRLERNAFWTVAFTTAGG